MMDGFMSFVYYMVSELTARYRLLWPNIIVEIFVVFPSEQ
jgi:hypothetical protein